MAHCLICINYENNDSLSVIQQNAFKLGHNIKLDGLNSLMALSVKKMGYVTCYEFFIGLSKNWELGGEMPYNR